MSLALLHWFYGTGPMVLVLLHWYYDIDTMVLLLCHWSYGTCFMALYYGTDIMALVLRYALAVCHWYCCNDTIAVVLWFRHYGTGTASTSNSATASVSAKKCFSERSELENFFNTHEHYKWIWLKYDQNCRVDRILFKMFACGAYRTLIRRDDSLKGVKNVFFDTISSHQKFLY